MVSELPWSGKKKAGFFFFERKKYNVENVFQIIQ